MQSISLIVFDWDGTLMDSQARIVSSMRLALDELDLDVRADKEISNIIGLGLREAILALYPDSDDELTNQIATGYRKFFMYEDKTPTALFSGVPDMLNDLEEAGYYLAVATGKGRMGLDHILEQTDLKKRFHVTRCADETRSKPHPQMLNEITDFVGVDSAHTLLVGDTEYDLNMAKNAGAHSLGVSYGVHETQRLLKCKPLDCVNSLSELHSWLCSDSNIRLKE